MGREDGRVRIDVVEQQPNPVKRSPRPSLGVKFSCCHVYWRIYLAADGSRFAGHCPKCGFPVSVQVSPTGSDSRFFEV
jgi:hypothetical protein